MQQLTKPTNMSLQRTRAEQEEALSQQVRSLTQDNNNLRSQVLTLMDQIELQKIKMQDFCGLALDKRNQQQSITLLMQNYQQREDQLKQELEQVVYKYNELMDFIHQNPQQERQYIKRLLKHKKIVLKEDPPKQTMTSNIVHTASNKEMEEKISYLEAQLLSRNAEIQRLQLIMVEDCVQIAWKKWKSDHEQIQLTLLKEEIAALQAQNQDLMKRQTCPSESGKLSRRESWYSKEKKTKDSKTMNRYNELKKCGSENNFKVGHEKKNTNQKIVSKETAAVDDEKRGKYAKINSNQYYNVLTSDPSNANNVPSSKQTTAKTQRKDISSKHNQGNSKDNRPKIPMKNDKIKDHLQQQQLNSSQEKNLNIQNHLQREKQKERIHISPPIEHHYGLPNRKAKVQDPKLARPSENNQRSSSSLGSEERNLLVKELQQKQARISELKELLKHSEKQKGHTTKNIHSQKTQTNNLIINENRNEYISISPPRRNVSESVKKKIKQLEVELQEAIKERDSFRNRWEEQQKETQEKKEFVKEAAREDEAAKREASSKMKQMQQKLISVNQENITLQAQLNDSLQLIDTLRRNQDLNLNHNQSPPEVSLPDDSELQRLKREVQRLTRELSVIRVQREVLTKQLRQTESELHSQSKQMTRFEKSIGKKMREISPSP